MRCDPEEIDFGSVVVGSKRGRRCRLLQTDGTSWSPDQSVTAASTRGIVQAVVTRTASPQLEVSLRADLPLGPFRDTLTLRPADNRRAGRLVVRGCVVARLTVSPSVLYFGDALNHSSPPQRWIVLRRNDGQALGPIMRQTAPAGIQVEEITGTGSGNVRRLRVTLTPGAWTVNSVDGQIVLWLEGEAEPVSVQVRAPGMRKAARTEERRERSQ